MTKEELYHFSLLVSETLFNLFDLVLGDIGKEISVRLPELPVDGGKVVRLSKHNQAIDKQRKTKKTQPKLGFFLTHNWQLTDVSFTVHVLT